MSKPRVKSGVKTGLNLASGAIYLGILDSYLRACAHPDAGKLNLLNWKNDYAGLLDWTESLPSPQMYEEASHCREEIQIAALIKKYPFNNIEVPGIAPEDTAIASFAASEHRCRRVNQRYRARRKRFVPNADFWQTARKFIERCIGLAPDIPSIMDKCDFTAGASLGIHGNATNFARKLFAPSWTCTPTALPYAMTALWLNVHARDCILPGAIKCYDPDLFRDLVRQRVELVDCNKVVFVPKDARTHRSIAVEPLLNGFVQKGVDVELRDCLRDFGLDLRTQVPNQILAFAGSLGGPNPYCTIDLKAASDSLAIEVVRDLIPPDWFEFLSAIRSPWYSMNGQSLRYEKFCSMGNGFCFPLQTLIFSSVCYAALVEVRGRTRNFSVYGDDIIVPQNVALLVIERLGDLGFKVNTSKTFITGSYRESCGRDWFQGQDVRPVILNKRITDIRQAFAFHNSTLRTERSAFSFEETRAFLRALRPDFLRPGIEPGDTCFSVPLDLAMTSPLVRWSREEQTFSWAEIKTPVGRDSLPLTDGQHANAVALAVLRGASSLNPYPLRYSNKAKVHRVSRPWTDHDVTFGRSREVTLFHAARKYRKLQRTRTGSWFVATLRREA